MSVIDSWRQRARILKRDVLALYLAYRDPRTPWFARVWTAIVVAYALSPIDVIPDFVPILGYLDDLILLPLGILIAVKLVPADVLAECRARADQLSDRPVSRAATLVIVALWLLAAVVALRWALDLFSVR